MRAICAWPPAGAGMRDFSTGFFGSVTSMIIVPLFSHALPFSGFGRNVGEAAHGHGDAAMLADESDIPAIGILDDIRLVGGAPLQVGVPHPIHVLLFVALTYCLRTAGGQRQRNRGANAASCTLPL